jgi:hypothetical protein
MRLGGTAYYYESGKAERKLAKTGRAHGRAMRAAHAGQPGRSPRVFI